MRHLLLAAALALPTLSSARPPGHVRYTTLTVTPPSGGGRIVGENIDCGEGRTQCSAQVNVYGGALLHRFPADGTAFAGWSGDCSGTGNSCTVLMQDRPRKVSAAFNTVTVTIDPGPAFYVQGWTRADFDARDFSKKVVDCGYDGFMTKVVGTLCAPKLLKGTTIVLQKTAGLASENYARSWWTGACKESGNGTACELTPDADLSAAVVYAGQIKITPPANGKISTLGHTCPGDCTFLFDRNVVTAGLTFTATPDPGYAVDWSRSPCTRVDGNVCGLANADDTSLTASFKKL